MVEPCLASAPSPGPGSWFINGPVLDRRRVAGYSGGPRHRRPDHHRDPRRTPTEGLGPAERGGERLSAGRCRPGLSPARPQDRARERVGSRAGRLREDPQHGTSRRRVRGPSDRRAPAGLHQPKSGQRLLSPRAERLDLGAIIAWRPWYSRKEWHYREPLPQRSSHSAG